MKKARILFAVVLFGISNQAFSQLKLYKEYGVEIMGSLEVFLEKNDFEYAIAAHSPSQRLTGSKTFTCLAKQSDIWYLFQISGPYTLSPVAQLRVRPVVRQKMLSASEIDSVMKIIQPDVGMKYSQQDLNALPKSCESVSYGKKGTFCCLSDAGTIYLAERSAEKVVSLSFYGAGTYIMKCLPLNPEFEILNGMVNTFQKLNSIATATFK